MSTRNINALALGLALVFCAAASAAPVELISISQFTPGDFDYSPYKVIVPPTEVKGDNIRVIVIGGVRDPGVYFVERNATISGLLSRVSYSRTASITGLVLGNNKSGIQVDFRVTEGSQRNLKIALERWVLNDGDVIFIQEPVG